MRQPRHRVTMRFAQGHISCKQYSWDLNASSLVWVMFLVKCTLLPFSQQPRGKHLHYLHFPDELRDVRDVLCTRLLRY